MTPDFLRSIADGIDCLQGQNQHSALKQTLIAEGYNYVLTSHFLSDP